MKKFWILFGFYVFLYGFFIYYPGLIRTDDFGYLQGVIESIAHGKIFTHNWIAPYSIPLTAISWLSYSLSGNFVLSTWGLQFIFVLINFVLVFKIICFRFEEKNAAMLTLAVTSLPFYFHKCSEFGGTVLTITLYLLSLLAYQKRQWVLFFISSFLAFANRQNSIALLSLPFFYLLFGENFSLNFTKTMNTNRRHRVFILAGVLLYGFFAFVLHHSINVTFAQKFAIYQKLNVHKAVEIFHTEVFGILAGLSMLSGFGLLMGENLRLNFLMNCRKPLFPLVLSVCLWLLPVFWSMPFVSFLTPLIGTVDKTFILQKLLLFVIPVLLWTLDYKIIRLDPPFSLFAAYIFISGLRGFWYDFYLMDIGIAALYLRMQREGHSIILPWAKVATGGIIFCNLCWAYSYKIFSDKQMITVSVYERLEREGKISVSQMTTATYGYMGWKLFDYQLEHNQISFMDAFLTYVVRDQFIIESQLPWKHSFRTRADSTNLIEAGTISVGYFPLSYHVLNLQGDTHFSICGTPPLLLDKTQYRVKPFPLSTSEWDDLISTRRISLAKNEKQL